MRKRRPSQIPHLRVAIIALFFGFVLSFLVFPRNFSFIDSSRAEPAPTPRPRRAAVPSKYSKFSHNVKAHKIECNSCHKFPSDNWKLVRAEKDAFPDITDYPKHQSCVNCHRQQFFRGRPPAICSICHTNPGPRNSSRFPFPNPRELFDATAKGRNAVSGFQIFFPHDKHIDIVSARNERGILFQKASWKAKLRAEESCSVCHTTYQPQGDGSDEYVTKPPANLGDAFWLKRGTFKTTPIGHTVCFTCHTADSGLSPAPNDCATCHKLKEADGSTDFDPAVAKKMEITDKIILTAWRKRDSSATFRHEWFSHSELACATCHNVAAMNTLDPATKKVAVTNCATCHATATSDEGGALNFEVDSKKSNVAFQCVKCHIAYGKQPVPDSHLKALAAATGKQ